jgi:toxin ParE1/3/4
MRVVFHPDAQAELKLAIDYYESSQRKLGYQFAVEVYAAIARITSHPATWPLLDDNVRRCLVHRFPYGVIYAYDQGRVETIILAVMHLHREPGYWSDRS